MSDPAPRLPARPSLEQLRKQAKELLRAFRNDVEDAVQRIRAVIPRLVHPAAERGPTLGDTQHVLARELGFDSWAKLVRHIEATTSGMAKYERLAAEVAAAYSAGDKDTIRRINWAHNTAFVWDHEPERMRRRLSRWYASPSRPADLALAAARHLVARQSGLDGWDELIAWVENEARSPRESASRVMADRVPFYRVDEGSGFIELNGPMGDGDWDRVLAVMKEMRLTGVRGSSQITDAALERLGRLDHVTSIDVSLGAHVTVAGVRHLANLPLRNLSLGGWGTQVSDEALAILREMPGLRRISLMWAQRISDAGVENLAGCTELEMVNLMGTRTGDGAVRTLAGKAKLSHLDLGTRVTHAGLTRLRDFPVFATPADEAPRYAGVADHDRPYLGLHPATFTHGGLDALADLHGIHSLRLFALDRSIPPVTASALEPVAGMRGIESLWCDPSDQAMTVIARIPRLRELMCQDTDASDDGWVALGRSTTIESIWGRRNSRLGRRGLEGLSAMPKLRTLGVNLRNVDERGLARLASFPALRDLTPIGLGDRGFAHVGKCTSLEKLVCMYTDDIGDGAIECLGGLEHLRRFYAGETSITDRGLEVLAALPALEEVELWDCPSVTNAGLAALAQAPRLRVVKLEGLPYATRAAATLFPPGVEVRISS